MSNEGIRFMTLKELQDEHKPWAERNFPNAKRWEPLIGIQEEVGELSHAFLKLHQGIRLSEDHTAKMIDAVGDILIYMADFCNRNWIDMQGAMEATWEKVKLRDWQNNKENGDNYPDDSGATADGERFGIDQIESASGAGSFERLGREIGALVDAKNQAYGNSFQRSGTVLRELYPDGISTNQYDDMLCIVRILDKLFRVANDKNAFGESPYRDIAGYGILGAAGKVDE